MIDETLDINIQLNEINKLVIECKRYLDTDKYAFYVYKDKKIIEKIPYSDKNSTVYWITEPGNYSAQVYVKTKEGEKRVKNTESVHFEGLKPVYCSNVNQPRRFRWVKNTYEILREIWQNRMRMMRLSIYHYSLSNKDSYLGKLWSILTPLIQIGTYWFVFGIGIRNNRPVDGHPFLPWMLCGLIPWFFFSSAVVQGASSIYSKSATILKLKYPVSTIPLEVILTKFYDHLMTLVILVVMLLCFGYYPNVYWFNLLYYLMYEFVFLTGFSMVTSVLTMIARDFQKLLSSLIRLWFYLTPILWSMDNLPNWCQSILRLNPALYIADGFRDSLLYENVFYINYHKIIFFWSLNVLLIVIGCNLQVKFRDRFIDML